MTTDPVANDHITRRPLSSGTPDSSLPQTTGLITSYRSIQVDGLDIFYREAGDPTAPTVVLLHGFPTSSHMFRDLIPLLADQYHLVAPDYPGFGHSAAPDRSDFDYTFDRLADTVDGFLVALGIERFAIYVQDIGAPIGFRLAVRHPDRIWAIVSQNGNAYHEGMTPFWEPVRAYWADPSEENASPLRASFELDAQIWQYTHGVRDVTRISPDSWTIDQALLDRPGIKDIQLALLYDYRTNPERYGDWQSYFREHQPPLLAVWGEHDEIFGPEGARAFTRHLPGADVHLLDTGHFALEESVGIIADLMRQFLGRHWSE